MIAFYIIIAITFILFIKGMNEIINEMMTNKQRKEKEHEEFIANYQRLVKLEKISQPNELAYRHYEKD